MKLLVGLMCTVEKCTRSSRTGIATLSVAACLFSGSAFAQTAADKATARQLATQGIRQFHAGKNADALELLLKAEQLYDAPVHLIYIARAQAALGKWVDAAETYRRLQRVDLAANAPQAFKDAVTDAHKELPLLEPKIPSLKIDVQPADAAGLQLKVDGESVSTVVIGINRPMNPGKHLVEASANAYEPASATVDVPQASKQAVTLRLKAKPASAIVSDPPPDATGGASAATTQEKPNSSNASQQHAGAEPPGAEASAVTDNKDATPFDKGSQIVIGVRGAIALPGGQLPLGGTDAQSVLLNGNSASADLKDRIGFGGGVDVHLGYRVNLGRRFALTPAVSVQSTWFDVGAFYNKPASEVVRRYSGSRINASDVLEMTPSSQTFTIGASLEFPMPTGAFIPSYYAELALIAADRLKMSGKLTTGTSACDISDEYRGQGLRAGLGLLFPLVRIMRLNAGISYSAIAVTQRRYHDNCPRSADNGATTSLDFDQSFSGGDAKVHSMFMANLGGEFLIGL